MTFNNDTTIIIELDLVKTQFVNQLPIIFLVFGFIGNVFTFLQTNLLGNTFCTYSLTGSLIDIINLFLNLLPNYLWSTDNTLALITDTLAYKWKLFGLVFVPQLSMNLLTLSLIDRYGCSCSLTSPLHTLRMS